MLGMFVVVGADKALRAELTLLPAIMFGVITATGGGLLRDLLSGEIPVILRPGSLYSSVAVLGSTVYVLMVGWLGVVKDVAALVAIGLAVALRLLAMWRGWQGPVPRDYGPVFASRAYRVLAFTPFSYTPREPAGPDPDDDPESSEESAIASSDAVRPVPFTE